MLSLVNHEHERDAISSDPSVTATGLCGESDEDDDGIIDTEETDLKCTSSIDVPENQASDCGIQNPASIPL
jgi:hypothetical protein